MKKYIYIIGNNLETLAFYGSVVAVAQLVNFSIFGYFEPVYFMISAVITAAMVIATTFIARILLKNREYINKNQAAIFDEKDKIEVNKIIRKNMIFGFFSHLTALSLPRQRFITFAIITPLLLATIAFGLPLLLNFLGIDLIPTSWIPNLITDFFGNGGGIFADNIRAFGSEVGIAFSSLIAFAVVTVPVVAMNLLLKAFTKEEDTFTDANRLFGGIETEYSTKYENFHPKLERFRNREFVDEALNAVGIKGKKAANDTFIL